MDLFVKLRACFQNLSTIARKAKTAPGDHLLQKAIVEPLENRTLLSATFYNWIGGTSGNWDTSTNNLDWQNAATQQPTSWPTTGDNIAVFPVNTGSANPAITIDSNITVGSIQFLGTTYTLTATNGSILTLANDTSQITVSGGTAIINAPIAGTGGLTLSGGSLVLGASNTYTGGTTVTTGNLFVGDGGSAGSLGAGTDLVTLDSSTNLAFNLNDNPTFANKIALAFGSENIHVIGTPTTLTGTISGVGVVFIGSPVVGVPSDPSPDSDGGSLTLSGSDTDSSPTVVEGGIVDVPSTASLASTDVIVDSTGSLTADGSSLGSMTTLDDDGSVALDDPIGTGGPIISAPTPTPISLSGDGSLTVSDGTLNLTGANTYTGTTTVTTNGTLSLQNPAGSATGTGNVTVNSGSTLDGNGSTTGSVTVAAGATIDPGVGTQTSTLNTGSVTFDSGSIFTAQINSTTSYDQLNVNGNVILNNPTLALSGTPTTQPGDQLTIIDNKGIDAITGTDPTNGTGTFAGYPEGSTIFYGGHEFSISYLGGANSNSVVLTDVTPFGAVGPAGEVLGDNINATATVPFSGEVGTFTTSVPYDIIAADYTATILWGDGNSNTGTIVPDGGSLYSVEGAYTYDSPGLLPLEIQIDDGSGDPATGVGSANVSDYLTVGTAASANLEIDGVTVDLGALGNDAAGPDQVTYSWSVTSSSGAAVIFDDNNDNSAQSTFATLSAADTYTFTCTMSNPSGQSVSSSQSLEVDQVMTSVAVVPPNPTIFDGLTTQLTATADDQFGAPMSSQPSFNWNLSDSTLGRVTQNGSFTAAPAKVGTETISAAANGITGDDSVIVSSSAGFSVNAVYGSDPTAKVDISIPPCPQGATQELEMVGPFDANFAAVPIPAAAAVNSLVHPMYGLQPQSNYAFRLRTEQNGLPTYGLTYEGQTSGGSSGSGAGSNGGGGEGGGAFLPSFSVTAYGIALGSGSSDVTINGVHFGNGATGPAVPAAPTNLTATPVEIAGVYTVRLLWDNTPDNETGFDIERSIDGGKTFTQLPQVSADTTAFVDQNPPLGVPLTYQVASYIGTGAPQWSQPVTTGFPAVPTGLSATADNTNGAVDLSWTDTQSQLAAGYEIQWSSDGVSYYTIDTVPAFAGQTQYTYTDTSPTVDGNETNYYQIVAYQNALTTDSDELESAASIGGSASVIAAPVAVDYTTGGNPAGGNAPFLTAVGKELDVDATDGVLSEDYDPQGAVPTVVSYTQPANGTVVVNENDGSFVYQPDANYTGTDSFTYTLTNGVVESDPAEVDIEVTNLPVVTKPDTFHVGYDQQLAEPAGAIAANDSNPSNATLTYRLAPDSTGNTTTQFGTLSFNTNGSFNYTPDYGFNGLDSFRYIANNGTQDSNPSIVVLSVGTGRYTVPNPPPAFAPPQGIVFDNSLGGVWASVEVSQSCLAQVGKSLAAFGAAARLCQNLDPTNPGSPQVVDNAIAALGMVTYYYGQYVNQAQAAVNLCGEFMKTVKEPDADQSQAINAVSALPIEIGFLKPNPQQLNAYRSAYENFQAGATFMVADSTAAVQVATETHDHLEHDLEVASLTVAGGGLIVSGAELLTKDGLTAASVYVVKKVVTGAIGVAITAQVSQSCVQLAQLSGFTPDQIRFGADLVQVFQLFKLARDFRRIPPSPAVQLATRQSTAAQYFSTASGLRYTYESFSEGIDFNKSVETETLPAGTELVQYQVPGRPTGNYFAPLGTPANTLGIKPEGRLPHYYTLTEDVTVLKSTANSTIGNTKVPTSAQGLGGGIQYFAADLTGFTMSK